MPRTVALDIETTGLDRVRDEITVVCLYGHLDGETVSSRTFNLLAGGREAAAAEIAALLDGAERVSCFNGTRFDIPFLQVQLGYDSARVGRWVAKMFDVFDIARAALQATFKLDAVLRLNGFETKSACGLQAIAWARSRDTWPLLEAYCLDDTRLTFLLSQEPCIRLPVRHSGGAYHLRQCGSLLVLEART